MELRFIKQRVPESISTLDEIELVNCDRYDGYMNGLYTVANVEPDTGDVTIVGKGKLEGHIALINLAPEE